MEKNKNEKGGGGEGTPTILQMLFSENFPEWRKAGPHLKKGKNAFKIVQDSAFPSRAGARLQKLSLRSSTWGPFHQETANKHLTVHGTQGDANDSF